MKTDDKNDPRKKNPTPPNKTFSWFWPIFITILIVHFVLQNSSVGTKPYSEFLTLLNDGKVSEVSLGSNRILAKMKDSDESMTVYRVEDETLIPLLKERNVQFTGIPESRFWETLLIWIFPLALLFFIFRGMMQMQGGKLFNIGKSRAKIYMEKDVKTTFADVAGVDEAKEELLEVVNFLKNPQVYSRLGGRAPKGILLVGPPGTGKTLMARAVAGEASVPFFSINGSEFVELFVGMGAARVRDLFTQARSQSPCIIFIDELDALGKARMLGGPQTGANDEKEQTLNQLLAELDGFDPSSGVVLLAATNRPEVLDPALLRAGRFDRQVLLDKPDQKGRLQILQVHAKKIVLRKGVRLEDIASMTPGFSGADLANLVNEAALFATRRNADAVCIEDFTLAFERIVAGLERRQRLISPDEKKRVAFHEMGHATVALALQCQDKIHKISIIPRGIGALGYTMQRPLEDRYLMTKSELMNKILVLLGGRASESNYCGEISTGASDDLVKASNIVRAMITQYGMSESLGLATEESSAGRFLQQDARPILPYQTWSDKTGEKIDNEIRSILDRCREQAEDIVRANQEFIRVGVTELLHKETLEQDEIHRLWEDFGKPHRPNVTPLNTAQIKKTDSRA